MRECCLFYARQGFTLCMECNRKIEHGPPASTCYVVFVESGGMSPDQFDRVFSSKTKAEEYVSEANQTNGTPSGEAFARFYKQIEIT